MNKGNKAAIGFTAAITALLVTLKLTKAKSTIDQVIIVEDDVTGNLVEGATVSIVDNLFELVSSQVTGNTGTVTFSLTKDKLYNFIVDATGYAQFVYSFYAHGDVLRPKLTEYVPPVVFICPYCEASFSTQGALDAHIVVAHPEPPNPIFQPLPGQINLPRDLDGDGLYEDLNGDGVLDQTDVNLFFTYIEWIEENEPIALFDFNGNGRIDFDDLVKLNQKIGA